MLDQMSFSFWNKPNPMVRFLAKSGHSWMIFDKEIEAIRWASKRPGATVETVIL